VALALSGGGARGIAHIGALRALEEAGLPVDAIAANSMGAIVGAIYASGRTADELERVVRSMDWAALFSGRPDRRTLPVVRREDRHAALAGVNFDWRHVRLPSGLLAEHRVNRFLIEYLSPASYSARGDFDRLPIPFRAVATDLASGERVILAEGDLARAVRASMSIPVLFPPVDWGGRTLVDGLVVDNLPTDVAKTFAAAVTVAVDVASPDLSPEEYGTPLGVASQLGNLLSRRRSLDYKAEPDVYVRPDLGKHAATEYSGFDELIRQGYEATSRAVPEIRERLAAAGILDLSRRPRPAPDRVLEGSRIAEVVARGNSRVSERLLRHTFNIPVGPGYLMSRGLRAFDKVEATGLLEHAWMQFEPAADGVRIVLLVEDAPPNRAEVGLGYTEWESARGSLRLRNRNTFGFGEQVELLLAASMAESLREVSLRGDRLLVPGLGYRVAAYSWTDKPRFFDAEGDEVNRGRFERWGASAALRSSLERWGLVEAGVRFGKVKTVPQAGVEAPEASDTVGLLFAGFTVDRLDDLLWPEAGERLAATAEWNLDALGASREYWQVRVEGRLGRTLGRRTVVEMDGLLGLSGQDPPVYDHFRVGGPHLIPGYHFEELKGPRALAAALSLRFRIVGELRLVARGGLGNVFASGAEMGLGDARWGVGIGAYYPTQAGPVAVELGVHDGGRALATLSLGWN
jgi:NTE family protein